MTDATQAPDPLRPRKAALDLMGDVLEDKRLLSEALPKRLARLAPEERARAQRLVTATFRGMDRADRLLGPHLRKRPPARILNLLRLATVEISAMGEAPHGVVNSAVALARADQKTAGLAGLTNAVLRKMTPELWSAAPTPRLPKWLRKPLSDDYGKDAVAAMEAAHFAGAPLDITPKGDGAALAERLGATLLPTGSLRLSDPGQVSTLRGFDAGEWWVQDAAAALPAQLLNPAPGARVLDLCAAPGGKTMQLAAMGADVTAVDISKPRMARVAENLERCGLTADLVTMDALEYEGGPFDAVLLDAPCSATGTIRRHPDLPYAKDGSDFPGLFELQEHLIDRALGMLKPGGRMVYCTCSLLIDEGDEQIRDALQRHPGLTVDPAPLDRPGIDPDWIGAEGGLRLRPDYWADIGGLDGFYMAVLVKA